MEWNGLKWIKKSQLPTSTKSNDPPSIAQVHAGKLWEAFPSSWGSARWGGMWLECGWSWGCLNIIVPAIIVELQHFRLQPVGHDPFDIRIHQIIQHHFSNCDVFWSSKRGGRSHGPPRGSFWRSLSFFSSGTLSSSLRIHLTYLIDSYINYIYIFINIHQ